MVFPLTHRWLGFKQASLTIETPMIGHADGTFFARLLVTGPVIATSS
jgi:4'-phosphopantetheinyl transferase EntD